MPSYPWNLDNPGPLDQVTAHGEVPGMCPVRFLVGYQYRSQLWAAGEPACRPGLKIFNG